MNKCDEVINGRIDTITGIFKAKLKAEIDRIVSCLDKCFKDKFITWARIAYHKYDSDVISFVSGSSFTDAVLFFSGKAEEGKIYAGQASLKTILFSIYRVKLLSHIQKEVRFQEKNKKIVAEAAVSFNSPDIRSFDPEHENLSMKLEEALSRMEAKDRQIVVWRHLEGKSPAEIASILDITIESASTRIYRCMQRLKKIIKQTDK